MSGMARYFQNPLGRLCLFLSCAPYFSLTFTVFYLAHYIIKYITRLFPIFVLGIPDHLLQCVPVSDNLQKMCAFFPAADYFLCTFNCPITSNWYKPPLYASQDQCLHNAQTLTGGPLQILPKFLWESFISGLCLTMPLHSTSSWQRMSAKKLQLLHL